MIDEHLGVDYDPAKRARLLELSAAAERQQDELIADFQAKRITPEEYLSRFTRWGTELFEAYGRVVGREDFVRLFGVPPEQALDFLDADEFRRVHGSNN